MYCQLFINLTDMVLIYHASLGEKNRFISREENSIESWHWALCDLGLYKQPLKTTLETTHTPLKHCG